jgi:hypothetical protein
MRSDEWIFPHSSLLTPHLLNSFSYHTCNALNASAYLTSITSPAF